MSLSSTLYLPGSRDCIIAIQLSDSKGPPGSLAFQVRKSRAATMRFAAASVIVSKWEAQKLQLPAAKASGSRRMSLSSILHRPDRRHLTSIGKLFVESVSLEQTARAFLTYCVSRERHHAERPLYSTSVNGQVISLCARDPGVIDLFRQADSINADGQPMVTLSRLLARTPLPERVATTDLFPAVAEIAMEAGLSFYILGASERVNSKAVEEIRKTYPSLKIVGRHHGYFKRDEEGAICAEIAALRPDILWVSLGAPLEQEFVSRNLDKLAGVGIVKTAGGLLDFLSLEKPRAPTWMQRLGFEWLFRTLVEPKRLLVRYVTTNPHALYVMLTSMR